MVRCFMLSNGQMIVGEVERESVKNPCVVMMIPMGDGRQIGMAMDDAILMGNADEIVLEDGAVMYSYELDSQFTKMYEEKVQQLRAKKSGIVLPFKK